MRETTYRTSLGILFDVLSIVKDERAIQSKLVRLANISWEEIKRYMNLGIDKGLIVKIKSNNGWDNSFDIVITQKGREFVNYFTEVEEQFKARFDLTVKLNMKLYNQPKRILHKK